MEACMKHSTGRPTLYEQERIDAMRKLGCVACAVIGIPNINNLELHHLLDGGVRMGHYFSIFLCRGHHQGDWTQGQLEWIAPAQRIAICDGRKLFNAIYGTERMLWERVQDKLRLPKIWPVSKRVPRGGIRHGHQERPVYLPPSGTPPALDGRGDVPALHVAAPVRDFVSESAFPKGAADVRTTAAAPAGEAPEVVEGGV